jgi:hypothetical protein
MFIVFDNAESVLDPQGTNARKIYAICQDHRALGNVLYSEDETEKAIEHLKVALGIASSSDWQGEQFWILHSLAGSGGAVPWSRQVRRCFGSR